MAIASYLIQAEDDAVTERSVQQNTYRCECGRSCRVEPQTPYEFDWRCICHRAGTIAWAHAADPPQFKADAPGLFDAAPVDGNE